MSIVPRGSRKAPWSKAHWSKASWPKAGLALLLVLLAAGCDRPAREPDQPQDLSVADAALTVAVETVARRTLERSIAATGSVAAWEEMTVSAQVSGIALVEVLVAEGDRVEAGQLLARLDDSLLAAQVAEQEAAVDEAQATLELAEATEARGKKLVGSAISQETQDQRAADTKTSRAQLAQAEAALALLRAQVAQTRIVAPAAGYVSRKPTALGTTVQVGTELFRLVRDSRLEVQADLPEQHLAEVRAGQPVLVTGPAGERVEASVRAVAETVDSGTRLGMVYVALPAGTTLRPGMFVRLTIQAEALVALTVPEAALVWRDGLAQVFALGDGDVVAARAVATGAREAGRVEITQGLAEEERVVVAGAGFLNDGDKVRVAVQQAATGAGEPAQ